MLVLDVGCGTGHPPIRAHIDPDDILIGADVKLDRLCTARSRYPGREFVCCRAEQLPFPNSSFDRIVSAVTLPYTDIPRALAEMRRLLKPEGSLFLSLHPLRFCFKELGNAFPKPVATSFRLYVLANGLLFHLCGRTAQFLNGRHESFQTRRGLTIALHRAGFQEILFSKPEGKLLVWAKADGPLGHDQAKKDRFSRAA